MKITQTAYVIATAVSTTNAISLRGLFKKQHQQHTAADIVDDNSDEAWDAADTDTTAIVHNKHRELEYNLYPGTNCQDLGDGAGPPAPRWYPNYSVAWSIGHCTLTTDCNSGPGYDTELDCCTGAYSSQSSGSCLQSLPNPPTTAPTESGDLDVYYPDYGTAWSEGACVNTRPLPSGRPNYSTLSECCAKAYRGQSSNACVKTIPGYQSPTVSPTTDTLNPKPWYPDYSKVWTEGECTDAPNPNINPNDRPHFATEIECCEASYGGQESGVCKKDLPDQPTSAPTTDEYDLWYPDYDTAWSVAGCSNARPLPFTTGSRPVYSSQLECCTQAYGGQSSNACVNALPQPPTSSPSESGGLDVYYVSSWGWPSSTCSNARPLPYEGIHLFDTKEECCAQSSSTDGAAVCVSN